MMTIVYLRSSERRVREKEAAQGGRRVHERAIVLTPHSPCSTPNLLTTVAATEPEDALCSTVRLLVVRMS